MNHLKQSEEYLFGDNIDAGMEIFQNCINGNYFISESNYYIERDDTNLLNYAVNFDVEFYDGLVTNKNVMVIFLLEYSTLTKKFTTKHISVCPSIDDLIDNTSSFLEYSSKLFEQEKILNYLDKIFDLNNIKIEKTKTILDEIFPKRNSGLDFNMFHN